MEYYFEAYANILNKYNIPHTTLREEFENILMSKDIEDIFAELNEMGILQDILPEFLPCIGLDQKNIHHSYTVDIHILKAVQYIAQNAYGKEQKILLWTMLLHDIGKPQALKYNLRKRKKYRFRKHENYSAKLAGKILKRFEVDKQSRKIIKTLVREHEFFRYIKLYNMDTDGNRMSTKHVFSLINKIGEHNFELLIECHKADYTAQSNYWKEHKNVLNQRAQDMLTFYKKLKQANMKVDY
jgi:tRNA nucleotidyltransferase (CCA-adding enzyme)